MIIATFLRTESSEKVEAENFLRSALFKAHRIYVLKETSLFRKSY